MQMLTKMTHYVVKTKAQTFVIDGVMSLIVKSN